MIIYSRQGNKTIAKFEEPNWIYSISNLFAKRGISERRFIENYLNRRTKFTGVASCSPEDEFDLEYGRKLAKERLLENYDQTVKKIASMLEEYLSDKYKRQNKALVNIQIH